MIEASNLLRIGTAGWSISAPHAPAFPTAGTHLERYATGLNAVEINSSFYRPHQRKTYERWAAAVPDTFRFAVKLPKSVTHERRLIGCDDLIARFCGEVSGLGPKLGVILIQLPPSLPFDRDALNAVEMKLRDGTAATLAIEPRHRSWFTPEVDAVLTECRIARVAADPAVVPAAAIPSGWKSLRYVRLHGSPAIYRSNYDDAALRRLHDSLTGWHTETEVWCIFDNTADGHALGNALGLNRLEHRSAGCAATA